jgi:chemotaxis protein MotB
MDDKHPEIIIIKRHSNHEEEHHGGAWKIAFADFMTAMMAFFLVLWIINATDKNTKTIIARYFNPLKLEDMAKAKKGIRLPVGDETRETKNNVDGAPQKQAGPAENSDQNDAKAPDAKSSDEKDGEAADPARPKASLSEDALLGDPYHSLDRIAGKVATPDAGKAGAPAGSDAAGEPAALDLDAIADPFKPLARGVGPEPAAAAKTEPAQQSAPAPSDAQPRPQAQAAQPPAVDAQPHPDAGAKELAAAQPAAHPAQAETTAAAVAPEAAKLQNELAKELRAEIHAQPAPGIEVQATSEGILISLTDEFNFGMFAVGSSEPQAKVVRIMEKIAQSLKSRPGAIVVRGHTDARPYKGTGYDNWRLSAARAQMAYYMLVRGGLDEKRVERIEGYADRRLKTPDKPEAAENRRIEILLRKEKS